MNADSKVRWLIKPNWYKISILMMVILLFNEAFFNLLSILAQKVKPIATKWHPPFLLPIVNWFFHLFNIVKKTIQTVPFTLPLDFLLHFATNKRVLIPPSLWSTAVVFLMVFRINHFYLRRLFTEFSFIDFVSKFGL